MSSKTWFRAGAAAIISLALSTTISFAQDDHDHGHEKHDRDYDDGHDRGHGHEHDRGYEREHEHGNGHDHFRYSDHDRDLRGWYHDHYRHLPPGLAKRDYLSPGLERQLIVNGTLPLGLRGRMQPCPRELEVMLPPPPPNFVHVVIGGNLVMHNRANFQVADVFHFNIN